jgi:hypothetical protein
VRPRGDALAASCGAANAIAFPSGSEVFTWRTPFERVSIGSCWRALGCEAVEGASSRVAKGNPARARPLRVRLDEEPGVLVDLPEDLIADATVWRSPEEACVPIDAGVEIGYWDAGERWVIALCMEFLCDVRPRPQETGARRDDHRRWRLRRGGFVR